MATPQVRQNDERDSQLGSGKLCGQGKRRLLVVSQGHLSEDIEATLAGRAWELVYVTGMEEAQSMETEYPFLVGLVILPQFHDQTWFNQCRQVVTGLSQIEWIAAINREDIKCDALQRFIVEALHDFQVLPLDPSRLAVVLGHSCGMVTIEHALREKAAPTAIARFGLIGHSEAMLDLYKVTERAAEVDAPVLISGNTGTGKEHVARAIHTHSARASGPFVALNCGAIPHSLLQSELFGHEKGAFTDAFQGKMGHLEAANGGTLLLDEIGEMPLESQASLLRFLEDKEVTRLGGTHSVGVDVRVVAATNRDLETRVDDKAFRADLYYRLAVLSIRTPDLNERREDIKDLAYHFLALAAKSTRSRVIGISDDALEALSQHEWPGNVRELRSCIIRATIACSKGYITVKHLDFKRPSSGSAAISLQDARFESEKQTLEHTLMRNRWNISRAARTLGVSRMTLYRLLEKHGITRDGGALAESAKATH